MNITVVGGGNIGTLMAAEAAAKGHNVTVYTSRPGEWGKNIEIYDKQDNLISISTISKATDDMGDSVKDADYIWVTVPAQAFEIIADKMLPYVTENQIIGIIPGFGGAEFAFKGEIDKGCTIFGMQRVHSIARLRKYGHSVYQLGRKKQLEIGAIPKSAVNRICSDMGMIFDMPCYSLDNYLSVTLTPSNPIFHTSRLYTLFKDWDGSITYPRQFLFHEEWNDAASEVLVSCDNELQCLCKKIPMNLSDVISLKEYYESYSVEAMTRKIKSIKAFKGLKAPMVESISGWIPDWNSRYFTADFDYGIKVLKDVCHLFDVPCPTMDELWNWYIKKTPILEHSYFSLETDVDSFLNIYR